MSISPQRGDRNHSTAAQGVIFDLDGVLVDSYEAHYESWAELAAENGDTFTRETFTKSFGRTSRETLAEHWSRPLTPADIARFDHRKEEIYRRIIAAQFPAMPGAADLIAALREAGFSLAVGSSAPPENVQLSLRGLECEDAFQAIVTGADVHRGKPDPEVFEIAARRLGLSPAQCAVIEDAPAGIQAARAAGAVAIAVISRGRSERELAAVKPHLLVNELRELNATMIRDVLSAARRANG